VSSVRLSCGRETDRQTVRQTDSEKTQSVCVKATERDQLPPHSAVNRLNTRRHTHTHTRRQASQCTQESAVKYQGEALTLTHTHTHTHTNTQVAGLDEVSTHTHTQTHTFSHWRGGQATYTHRSGGGVLPVCGRA